MRRFIIYKFTLLILVLFSCVEQGEIGPSGLNSLINIDEELPSEQCPLGGVKVESGLDVNRNGRLEGSEVQSIQFVCKEGESTSALNSLINMEEEQSGEHCPTGGIRIDAGLDTNKNGILEASEVQSIQYVCQGEIDTSGFNSLINVDDEPAGENCSSGGIRLEVGMDTNSNGILDETEIQSTRFVCHGSGAKGVVKEIRFLLGGAHSHIVDPASTLPLIHESQLFLFDINNYPEVDSIVYVINNFETERISDNTDVVGYGFLELYDLTHSQVISKSLIKSDNAERIISKNLIGYFPNGAFDLGFRIYSENEEYLTRTGNIYLILYRR